MSIRPSSECQRTDKSRAEILAACLDAIVSGEATVETSVARYPEFESLGDLLSTSQAVQALPQLPLSETAKADIRARMLAKHRAMQIPAQEVRPIRETRSLTRWWRVAAAVVVLVTVLSGSALVRASDSAVPGEALYSLKRRIEQIELAFADSQMWPDLVYRHAQLRLSEMSILTMRHQPLTTEIVDDVTDSVRMGVAFQRDQAKRTQLLTQAYTVLEQASAQALLDPTLKVSVLKRLAPLPMTPVPTNTPISTVSAPSATASLNPSPTNTHTPTFTATMPLTATLTTIVTDAPTLEPTYTPTKTVEAEPTITPRQPVTATRTAVRRTNIPGGSGQRPTQRPRPTQKQNPTQSNPGGQANNPPGNNGGGNGSGNGNGSGGGKGK